MPVVPRWTVAKQCLANPREFRDLKTRFTIKRPDAIDETQMLWFARRNGAKVDWLISQHCNEVVLD